MWSDWAASICEITVWECKARWSWITARSSVYFRGICVKNIPDVSQKKTQQSLLPSILLYCTFESYTQNLRWQPAWGRWNWFHNGGDARAAGEGCECHHGNPTSCNKCRLKMTWTRQCNTEYNKGNNNASENAGFGKMTLELVCIIHSQHFKNEPVGSAWKAVASHYQLFTFVSSFLDMWFYVLEIKSKELLFLFSYCQTKCTHFDSYSHHLFWPESNDIHFKFKYTRQNHQGFDILFILLFNILLLFEVNSRYMDRKCRDLTRNKGPQPESNHGS